MSILTEGVRLLDAIRCFLVAVKEEEESKEKYKKQEACQATQEEFPKEGEFLECIPESNEFGVPWHERFEGVRQVSEVRKEYQGILWW